MNEIEPNILALAWFGLLFAVGCLAVLVVAGMFPLSLRPQPARAAGGLALIAANLAALPPLLAGTALYGWDELRWTSLVIGGGLVFLFAPLLLDVLPPRWRDGRPGLAALLAAQLAALSLLHGAPAVL
ncbi:hypothetical protein [Azospirillum sp. ST 5-10]|uniref:hypothetical protein n=1 Tax=unclassified Azospirillum TaxID=2630922 RepID=UPI003F49D705